MTWKEFKDRIDSEVEDNEEIKGICVYDTDSEIKIAHETGGVWIT